MNITKIINKNKKLAGDLKDNTDETLMSTNGNRLTKTRNNENKIQNKEYLISNLPFFTSLPK